MTHGRGSWESRCALVKVVRSDVMSTSDYTGLNTFKFIRHHSSTGLYRGLSAQRLSESTVVIQPRLYEYSEVCHPRCAFKPYGEVNSVKKHNYKIWLNDGVY